VPPDTAEQAHPWLAQTLAWFGKHPEREFNLTTIPIAAIQSAGHAGWIVGVASQPIRQNCVLGADVAEGATSVPCIVRRPDPVGDRPTPGVFIIDGAGATPPLPYPRNATPAQKTRAEEKLAEYIWGMAQAAALSGHSLLGAARAARSAQTTPRSR
jgi:hypothetical protein